MPVLLSSEANGWSGLSSMKVVGMIFFHLALVTKIHCVSANWITPRRGSTVMQILHLFFLMKLFKKFSQGLLRVYKSRCLGGRQSSAAVEAASPQSRPDGIQLGGRRTTTILKGKNLIQLCWRVVE